jgi:hypothetical protein
MKNKINLMELLKSKLYLFIVGIVLVFLHIYFRFFKARESYYLKDLKGDISFLNIILSISFILIQLVTIITIFYYLYRKYNNIQKNSIFIQNISKIVDHLYWKPLEYIHDIIAPDLPYSGTFIIYITKFLEKGNQPLRYKLYRHSYILFEYIPQLLVSIIFFIDIVIYNQLYYFLYFIILLLLPILYQIYLKLSLSFVIRNEPEFLKRLLIIPKGSPDTYGVYLQWEFSLKPFYAGENAFLNQYIKEYLSLQRIRTHIIKIKFYKSESYFYIVLFTSSLYLSAAIYRLIYILF